MEDKNLSCVNINSEINTSIVSLDKGNKKNVMLNLGLMNKPVEEVDETPTPTRLIRNCEEVGLFQDLQNVNPFDEYFKKAVENKDYNIPASNTTQPTDDSLHTPQIYPQPEEQIEPVKPVEKFGLDLNLIDSNDTNESDDALMIINSDEEDHLNRSKTNNLNQNGKDLEEDVKEKVKTAIIQKVQGLKPVPLQKLQQPKTAPRPNREEFLNLTHEERERREANRWAQARSRVKKRKEWDDMRTELKELRIERAKLLKINTLLEEKVERLEAQLQSVRFTKVINNDDVIPLHVIQKSQDGAHIEDPRIPTIPSIVKTSQDFAIKTVNNDNIVQTIEQPTIQKTTIVHNHSRPIHLMVNRINHSNIRILEHTQIVPQNNPSNALFVIVPPQNIAKRKPHVRPLKIKKEPLKMSR